MLMTTPFIEKGALVEVGINCINVTVLKERIHELEYAICCCWNEYHKTLQCKKK